ncbi:helix-turn-helix transcriptional regulator [Calidifontibacillus oryziterrae]|uniref:helix-turn-helix transcriptional regulator n=1 Tax=Calidifontibacillus oryziterrae TaxID=1191699 RepID=UPI0002E779A3|nr:helix-turn-helix transcriptional regulator [Calidifontibacillus oryziterrae]
MERDLLKPEEVASLLKISKYTVYEMVKRGELQAIRIGRKMRFDPETIQKFTEGRQHFEGEHTTYRIDDKMMTSYPPLQPFTHDHSILFLGSHDLAVEELANAMRESYSNLQFFTAYIGSMDGLMNLYFGKADIAGCHLLDEQSGKYNEPFVSRIFPGEPMKIIHFVNRNIGWIVSKGNPQKLSSWDDIARPGLKFVNRQKGAGTRILFDYHIRKRNLSIDNIFGYDEIEHTHFGAASKVARGLVDVALGSESAAKALGLDFILLTKESYDFVMKPAFYESAQGQAFISVLKSPHLQSKILSLGGYDLNRIGELI